MWKTLRRLFIPESAGGESPATVACDAAADPPNYSQAELSLFSRASKTEYQWTTFDNAIKDDYGHSRLGFSVQITCENRVVINSYSLHHVTAQTDEDERYFKEFSHVLKRLEDECKATSLRYWETFMKGAAAHAAEEKVIGSDSFRKTFRDIFVFLEDQGRQYLFYKGTVWAVHGHVSEEQWQSFIERQFSEGKLESLASEEKAVDSQRQRTTIPERVRNEVWRRDQARCVRCGSKEKLEFDHIIPVVKGGSSTTRNIELLCESCNRQKGADI